MFLSLTCIADSIQESCYSDKTEDHSKMPLYLLLLLGAVIIQGTKGFLTPTCVKTCATILAPGKREFCDSCVKDVLPTAKMCIYACDNIESWLYLNICDKCMEPSSLSSRLCDHACKQKDSFKFSNICHICGPYY